MPDECVPPHTLMMNELEEEEDIPPVVNLNDADNEWTYGNIPGFHELDENDNDNV